MFQYYLRREGLAMSWVGTGRLLVSLDFTDKDLAEVRRALTSAAEKMRADGWWYLGTEESPSPPPASRRAWAKRWRTTR